MHFLQNQNIGVLLNSSSIREAMIENIQDFYFTCTFFSLTCNITSQVFLSSSSA